MADEEMLDALGGAEVDGRVEPEQEAEEDTPPERQRIRVVSRNESLWDSGGCWLILGLVAPRLY